MSRTIDVEVGPGSISPAALADIQKFEQMLAEYLAGDLDEDRFRIFRLNNGIYGQRQGGHNQMVRIKVPYGSITPEQLDMMAHISETYSRGWGHITTRQNIQFHFVNLERVPSLMRDLARVGMTSREACGDTVRNIIGCHLAGACPFEVLDISPWAEAAFQHFLRHGYSQRLPRKFKINFSGCVTDCGQAMFNDVGVIAVNRPTAEGGVEPGFRVFVAGGLGANPHPAQALEEFTPREELLPTLEACLRTFDHYGNRENKLRARMKWLVDTMGMDELRRKILKERKLLLAATTWAGGIPDYVREHGDEPAGGSTTMPITPIGQDIGTNVVLRATDRYGRWDEANVVRGTVKGTVSALAYARLGDITTAQFRAVAAIQRELGCEVRVTNRQNFVFRGLTEDQLPGLFSKLDAIGMAMPGAELARDVVSCPGADTCNLAVTQSRGLADEIGKQLEEAGLADVGGVRINISGCTNSCGQHHIADIGFVGVERRAYGQSAPGYQIMLGGRVGSAEIEFGRKAMRVPAKRAGEASVRLIGRFAAERSAGETFGDWLDRSGGVEAMATYLADLDHFPHPDEAPDFYVDYDETGPYVAEVGAGECAGS
jgi:sulfite reductase beta subunit-like hemoprotein